MNTVKIMHEEISIRKATDSGAKGDAGEIAACSYIMGRRVHWVKKADKPDIRFSGKDGKRYTAEIKTACGELNDTYNKQFVFYCPDVDENSPIEGQMFVFTREEWLTFLNGYKGRGQLIRYDSKRGLTHIQSFYVSETVRPKASKPLGNYVFSAVLNQPTLEEFFAFRH